MSELESYKLNDILESINQASRAHILRSVLALSRLRRNKKDASVWWDLISCFKWSARQTSELYVEAIPDVENWPRY